MEEGKVMKKPLNNRHKVSDKNTHKNINDSHTNGKTTVAYERPLQDDLMVNDAVLRKLRTSFANIQRYFDENNSKLMKTLEMHEEQIADLKKEVTDIKKINNELEINLNKLTKESEECKLHLSTKIEHLESSTDISKSVSQIELNLEEMVRKHSLIVENLCPNKDSLAYDFLKVSIKSLGIDITASDIEKIHSFGGANDTMAPPSFLVTFTCCRTKSLIYSKWLQTRVSNKITALSSHKGQGIIIKV